MVTIFNRKIICLSFIVFFIIFNVTPENDIGYNLTEAYIDYNFGFVKRGLFSEILNLLSINRLHSLRIILYICTLFLIFTITIKYQQELFVENNFENFLIYGFIFLNPFFIKNYFFDVGKKDILFISLLLLIGLLKYRMAGIMLLLLPIMVFIHEGMAILFFPAFTFLFYQKFKTEKSVFWFLIAHTIIFTICILCILIYGKMDVSFAQFYTYLKSHMSEDLLSADALKFYYYSYSAHLQRSMGIKKLIFLLIFPLPFWGFLLYINAPLLSSFKKMLSIYKSPKFVLIYLILGALPLYIIAVDRVRFTANIISIFIVIFIILDKKLFFETLKQEIRLRSPFKQFIIIAAIFAIPYAGITEPAITIPGFHKIRMHLCDPR